MAPKIQKGVDVTGVSVVFFCHDGRGNYLFNKRNANARDEQRCWCPGGGAVEFGDTIEATLQKEIAEEYCTDVLDYAFLGYRDVHREEDNGRTHWIALDFRVLIDPDRVANGEPHKFDALEWFRIDAVPEPRHSQLPHCLELYRDRL